MPPTPRAPKPKKKSGAKSAPPPTEGSNRKVFIAMGVAVVVVVLSAAGYAFLGGSDSAAANPIPQLEAAGCTVKTVAALPSGDHSVTTPDGTSKKWNTSPPTSGPHYQQWAVWGAYSEPLLQAQVVHNLEHGGIFIQYGKDVPEATVEQLKAFYDGHQNGTLLAPLPSLGSKIAMGVWTTESASSPDKGTAHLAMCTAFDDAAYAAFFSAYQFKGPERFPSSSLLPGT
jgi:hypothetical protein